MSYTIAGYAILDAQVYEPRIGCWTADIEADSASEDISGAVTIQLGSVTLDGTIHRGGITAGRWVGRVVGGAGGLDTVLQPKNYAGANLAAVVADIMTASGETLDSSSVDLTSWPVGNWQRMRGPAGSALQAVADELAVPWRMTRDGTILLGPTTPTTLDTDEVQILERPDVGSMVVAPEGDPLLRPGVLFDGREVSYVATIVSSGSIRQELWFDDSTGSTFDRIKGSLLKLIDAAVGRRLLYAYLWPCTVATQAGDGSLEVVPDDVEIKGGGLGKIFIRHGQPGYQTTVPAGARCMVGFEAGDPRRPYVAQWLAGTNVTEIAFDGGSEDIARTNDSIQAGWLFQDIATKTVFWAPDVLGLPSVWVPFEGINPNTPAPPNPGPTGTFMEINVSGDITSGNAKLKA